MAMAHHVLFTDVLGDAGSRELYEFALGRRALFERSRTSPNRLYPDWRKSTVVYDRDLSGFAARIETEVRARVTTSLASLGMRPFAVGSLEIQLTHHDDGEYYHWHTDNGSHETSARALSFVYYFHALPKPFTGGELVLFGPQRSCTVVEPRNDSLVLFESGTKHEVRPICCPSRRFEDGRFTLNGWVRRDSARASDYFDAKIFSVPRRASRSAARASGGAAPAKAAPARASGGTGAIGEPADTAAHALALQELQSELFRQSQRARVVDVRHQISGDEFFEKYYFANRPVLLQGALRQSPAVRTWSPSFLAARHGAVPVTLTSGRASDPDYELNFAETVHTSTLRELVARLEAEPESNDYYLVARNLFFEQPALSSLRDDLCPPRELIEDGAQKPGAVKLWLGPRGTVTPLHHDEHSILFAQVFGSKRFKLIPPFNTPYLYLQRRYYSAVDPDNVDWGRHPEFRKASVAEVIVRPGDALFLPAGWWHWVQSLDVSISATFCSFRVPGQNNILRTPLAARAP
jgi:cupin-like protein/2-oxoglutarate-Fe(II)-dependent oxygenase superfamily protein